MGRLQRSTPGVGLSVNLIALELSVTATPRSDVAGRLGATQSVEQQLTRAGVAGKTVAALVAIAGHRSPSAHLTTRGFSASTITRSIVAITVGFTWIAALLPRVPGGVDDLELPMRSAVGPMIFLRHATVLARS